MQLTTAVITNLQITVAMSHLPKVMRMIQRKVTYFLSIISTLKILRYIWLTSQSWRHKTNRGPDKFRITT